MPYFHKLAPRAALACALLGLVSVACNKVKYPRCGTDADCKGHHEVCVAGQCQECRADADCQARYSGEGRTCNAGRCEAPAGCHDDDECRAKQPGTICRAGACMPGCRSAKDCATGAYCRDGACRPNCKTDQECAANEICSEGACQTDATGQRGAAGAGALPEACRPDGSSPGQVLRLDAVRFEFNKFELTGEVMAQLQQVAECLRHAPQGLQVVVEGHCDDRGTQEYNLALGQKRAQSVVDYLVRLGAQAEVLSPRSKGENEPACTTASEECYGQNRRVEFIQSQGGAP